MSATLEVLAQHLPDFTGDAWLVRDRESGFTFIASGTSAMLTGWEVLVFPAEGDGQIASWAEVVGGRGISHDKALDMLADHLNTEPDEFDREYSDCPHCRAARIKAERETETAANPTEASANDLDGPQP